MNEDDSKDHHITARPDILVHTREPAKDEFIILACDGVWDRLSNRDCSDLVQTLVRDEGKIDVGLICKEIADAALELDSKDNITCLLVMFPCAGMGDSSPATDASAARWLRRSEEVMGRRVYPRHTSPAEATRRGAIEIILSWRLWCSGGGRGSVNSTIILKRERIDVREQQQRATTVALPKQKEVPFFIAY